MIRDEWKTRWWGIGYGATILAALLVLLWLLAFSCSGMTLTPISVSTNQAHDSWQLWWDADGNAATGYGDG